MAVPIARLGAGGAILRLGTQAAARTTGKFDTLWEQTMPIDLAAVNWAYVGILSGFAFVTALLGSLISFRNRFIGAIITGVLFAAGFVYWTYYPHPNIPGPIRVGLSASAASESPAPASPAPMRAPANPVSTVSPTPMSPAPMSSSPMSAPPASPAPAGAK
jgi:hypothetical protein